MLKTYFRKRFQKRLSLGVCWFFYSVFPSIALAKEGIPPSQFDFQVSRQGEEILLHVHYIAPLNECNAYAFLTDYENAKMINGVKESKIISREGNVVLVERLIEERVLGFPIEMRSLEKYIEQAPQKIDFEQIKGEAKKYQGTWALEPAESGTTFNYQAVIEMGSFIPKWVITYFIKNSAADRFKQMASFAREKESYPYAQCKTKN